MSELTWLVPETCAGQRLDHALAHCLPELGVRGRRRLCERGLVLVQDRPASAAVKVRAGQRVRVMAAATRDGDESSCCVPNAPRWVHHDAALGALYKPAGWHSARLPGLEALSVEGCLEQLTAQLPSPSPTSLSSSAVPCLLNRLDRLTSGLLMVALSAAGYDLWQQAEQAGTVQKRYLAVVEGSLSAPYTAQRALDTAHRTITRLLSALHPDPLRHTHITPLAQFAVDEQPLTLVQCDIHKGARHQIRIHLAGTGHPLWGDALYGSTQPHPPWLHHGRVQVAAFTAHCLPPWLDELPEPARAAAVLALEQINAASLLQHPK